MISRLRREFCGVLLAGLLGLGLGHGWAGSVEVHSPGARLVATAPGRIVTTSIVVLNRDSQWDEIVEKVELPEGCQKVAPPDVPFRLDGGGQVIRVLAIAVPSTMAAGRVPVKYVAQSKRDPSSLDSLSFDLEVTPVDGIEFKVDARRDIVVAGDTYPAKLHVTNRGNLPVEVTLVHKSNLGFAVFATPASFRLGAGETKDVSCRIETPAKFAQHTSHAVTFDVTATTSAGKVLQASQASVAEIIPRVNGSQDPYHYFPMQLKLTTLADNTHNPQLQAELSGAGSLDEAGKDRVDFVFRGPDVQTSSLFGERDEYGIGYRGEHLDLDLGDRVYSLSPLTEKHSMGRGVGVAWHEGDTSVGGFYMQTRFRRENTEEVGAYVKQSFGPGISLQGNFLRKWGTDYLGSGDLPQNLFTLEGHYRWGKLLELDAEVGLSVSDSGETDHAYRVDARGELPGKVAYAVEHVHAGPNFHGYYGDNETTYATVSKTLAPNFRVHASVNRYAGNLALNDVKSSVVNRENSWNVGMDYDLNRKTTLSAEWQHTSRADILQPAAYDFSADGVKLGANHDFGKLKLVSCVECGTLDNSLAGQSGSYQRYSASAFWRPTDRQTYSVFASYGPSAYTGKLDKELSAGVNATWRVNEKTQATLSYARNQFDTLTGNQQDQLMGTLRYEFENKSALSVIGRYSHAKNKAPGSEAIDESAVMVSYTMPLSVPVSKKRSIGAVQGRVVDVSRAGSQGVPRIVLQIGEKFAVTDEAGNFEFPGIAPGNVELKVVADSLGPKLALLDSAPVKLRVRAAETTRAEVKVGAAGTITVNVVLFDFADGKTVASAGTLKEVGGLGGVTLELAKGSEIWRAQTDRLGVADFERLASGEWTLRAAAGDLPAYHTLETPRQTVSLEAGKSREVTIRILPQKRTVKMLDQGTIR